MRPRLRTPGASTALCAWRFSSIMLTAVAMSAAIAHGIFWAVVHPVNVEMKRWSLDAIPEHWRMARARWKHGHAARAFLVIGALAALTLALLEESADSTAG